MSVLNGAGGWHPAVVLWHNWVIQFPLSPVAITNAALRYLAPELEGSAEKLDRVEFLRCDVWALGPLCWKFSGTAAATTNSTVYRPYYASRAVIAAPETIHLHHANLRLQWVTTHFKRGCLLYALTLPVLPNFQLMSYLDVLIAPCRKT
jgi:hypothetical protein